MPFKGVADDEQLSKLTKLLDDHCQQFGIPLGDEAADRIGGRIMTMYTSGFTVEQIAQRFDRLPKRHL